MDSINLALESLMYSFSTGTGNYDAITIKVTPKIMNYLMSLMGPNQMFSNEFNIVQDYNKLQLITSSGAVYFELINGIASNDELNKLKYRIKELEHTLNTMDDREELC